MIFSNIDFKEKFVVLRADLDVSLEDGKIKDETRLNALLETLSAIYSKGAKKITIVGHRGRPSGVDLNYSLLPIVTFFKERLFPDVYFCEHKPLNIFFETFDEMSKTSERLVILENIRFYKEEEENSPILAEQLSYFGDIYVNESFATSHRKHASTYGLPSLFKSKNKVTTAGLTLKKEVSELAKIRSNPNRPFIVIISGAKEDKLTFLPKLKEIADLVLMGGRLPTFLPEENVDPKLFVSQLNPDKEDITLRSIERMEQEIMRAKTIFLSGPIGHFEDVGQRLGTTRVFNAIAKSLSFKVAGGGDTLYAINTLKLSDSFDFLSTGGGASLEFVALGELPSISILGEI